jgi:predicted Zn-dependent protease
MCVMSAMLRLLLATAVLALGGCGVNPVTGQKEVQFVSEAQELQIGATQYAPSRQSQGGDYRTLPELNDYVAEVGQKLAAVADRALPYEFVVLNSSVPNAWALPGGKIAVNRGLLTTLDNEAELAAVLGHEIVHAAARHGAKMQERGTLLQAGVAAAQIGAAVAGVDPNLGNLVVGGAGVGAQLIAMRYGRDAELEADLYGMRYLRKAGYDPRAAVTLQQKFLALSQKDGSAQQGRFEQLLASHPPSAERVTRNQQTSAELGEGGELGAERYQARIAPLVKLKPAYDKADEAMAAAKKKDLGKARTLAAEAAALAPREARFPQLQGDVELADKKPKQALPYYDRALALDGEYFGAHLGAGIAAFQAGDKPRAERALEQSAKLLPTAPAYYYLGQLAKERGDLPRAMTLLREAAGSSSEIGRQAAVEYVTLDLPRNPGNYVATAAQLDSRGNLLLVLENRAPVALAGIVATPLLVDALGQVVRQGRPVQVPQVLQSGQRTVVDAGVGAVSPQQLGAVKFRIDGLRVAQ